MTATLQSRTAAYTAMKPRCLIQSAQVTLTCASDAPQFVTNESGRLTLILPAYKAAECRGAVELQFAASGEQRTAIELWRPNERGELGFTLCEVPVTYWVGERSRADVEFANGALAAFDSARLDAETSSKVFARSGEVVRIEVELDPAELRGVRA